MNKFEPLVFLFILVPVLLACNEEGIKCRDKVYAKSAYKSVECSHSEHRLIEQEKNWFCKCAKPVASASASASVAAPAPKPSAKPVVPAPKPKDDYSWLDTKY